MLMDSRDATPGGLGWWRLLAAASVVLVAALFLLQLVVGLRLSLFPSWLPVVNILVLPLGSVPLAVLAAVALARTGRLEVAWLGAGVIALGLAVALANWVGTPISADAGIKIQNLGPLEPSSQSVRGPRRWWLCRQVCGC